MILYPAIDLKDGMAVRLLRGEMGTATVFNQDPADQAHRFQDAGFHWLHIVDLNGAFEGRPVNRDAVQRVLEAASVPVQLGGGIRDLATVGVWLAAGVTRVVLGTAAVKNPDLVREACRLFAGRIAVGIDARGGRVAVEGWSEDGEIEVRDLALRFADAGVAALIFTDIERDGALQGPNVEATAALAEAVPMPVIASGGISSLDDIARFMAVEASGIEGLIIGRALYDGHIEPGSAIALVTSGKAGGEAVPC